MPELPEVETVRLQLLRHVVGKTIKKVTICHQKTVGHDTSFSQRLTGKTIKTIDRIGKLMIVSFRGEKNLYLLCHLKMTGQFFFINANGTFAGGGHTYNASLVSTLPSKHTRVIYFFTDGSKLFFNDMRLFGYTKIADAYTVSLAKSAFGPEPIAEDFDFVKFAALIRNRKRSIKAVLLDQSVVAGLGNIYVDEALWQAQVAPYKIAATLTAKEAKKIAVSAREVLQQALTFGGTTFRNFTDTQGEYGNFRDYLAVFGRQGEECRRCQATICKTKIAGRGTHYCNQCQT